MENRMLIIFNRIIEYGIIFLIVFTPFAFGSVQLWAYSIMELTIGFLVIIWISKLTVINIKKPPTAPNTQSNQQIHNPKSQKGTLSHRDFTSEIPGPDRRADRTRAGRNLKLSSHWFPISVNRFGFAKTPLNIPITVFTILILFQLTPLPPVAIKILSPDTYHLYKSTLPGWPEEEPFSRKSLSSNENSSNDSLASTNQIYSTESEIQSWRTISIYPYATRSEFLKILSYIGIFFLITNTHNLRINRIISVMIGVGFLISFIGILQNLSGTTKIYWIVDISHAAQPFGAYVNRNHFAGYMGMVVPLTVGLLISRFANISFSRTMTWRSIVVEYQSHLFANLLLIFAITVMISSIFLSLSRGGIISFIISMVFFIILIGFSRAKVTNKRGRSMIIIVLTLSLIFLAWIGIGPVLNRLSDLSLSTRYDVYENTLTMAKDFPLFGTGAGTFQYLYPKYKTLPSQSYYLHTENDYLELLSDNGLIGFLTILIGFILFFKKILTRCWRSENPYVRGITIGGVCSVVAILSHSLVDFNLHIPANALFFTIILGLIYNTVNLRSIKLNTKPS